MTNIGPSKTTLVTGGTRGIGLMTAEQLCGRGHHVVLTGRTPASAEQAVARIRQRVPAASVEGAALDLGSLQSVRAFAASQAASERPLNALICNAGVMERLPEIRRSQDGFELMFAANHLGHFLLAALLLPRLLRSAPSRVVVVSSRWSAPGSSGPQLDFDFDNLDGHKSYDPVVFYKNSKLANLWFAFELARRLEGTGVTVNAVCPGFVPASLAESQQGFQRLFTKYLLARLPVANSPAKAAANTVFVATDPAYASRTGKFVGECQEVVAYEEARDPAKAERLWQLSCKLCGIDETVVNAARAVRKPA